MVKYLWFFMAMAGICLRYWINRRAFNRRNVTGTEGFRSYEQMRGARLLEGIGRIIGLLLVLVGTLLFLLMWVTPGK